MIHMNIKLTRSAMLCGSVACPRLARTLGRIAGGCGAAATVLVIGWPWKTCRRIIISSTQTTLTTENRDKQPPPTHKERERDETESLKINYIMKMY